ncbi:MAG: hypothetical protein QMC78_03515 [Methanocellales archaeon]|nr:hypothetical protein [Methanocellales archaeon]
MEISAYEKQISQIVEQIKIEKEVAERLIDVLRRAWDVLKEGDNLFWFGVMCIMLHLARKTTKHKTKR